MPNDDFDPVLRRKLTRRPPPTPIEVVDTGPAAALVRAFARSLSANTALVAEDAVLHRKSASLAELLDTIEPDAFVITLVDGAQVGLALLDQTGFSTLIEAMTVGRLSSRASDPRRATATDATLLAGIIDTSLGELGAGDPATRWRSARPVPDHRLLGILLDDGDFDLIAVTAQLVAGDVSRPARLMLALPRDPASPEVDLPAAKTAQQGWSNALEASVLAAPASLRAELGRVTLPLAEVLQLGVGSSLVLPLSNLEEVQLVALDGSPQGMGRLGQSRGMRAIRLTQIPGAARPDPVMQDAAPRAVEAWSAAVDLEQTREGEMG